MNFEGMGRRPSANRVVFEDEEDDESSDQQGHNIVRKTRDEIRDLQKLVCWETNNLRCWRTVIVVLLLSVGVTIAVFTYFSLRDEEEQSFKDTYDLVAQRTESATSTYIESRSRTLIDLANIVTTAARKTESQFPLVTVPHYEVSAYYARLQTGIKTIAFTPIVTQSQKEDWANYTWDNRDWLTVSRDFLKTVPRTEGSITLGADENGLATGTEIVRFIWQTDALGNKVPAFPPPHTPVWQLSPPPLDAGTLNYNALSESFIAFMFQTVLIVREAVISGFQTFTYEGIASPEANRQFHADSFSNLGDRPVTEHPHSMYIEPVFQKLKDRTSPIVGLLQCTFTWDTVINGLVTEGASGIFAILSNSCGEDEVRTYVINETIANYMGPGDLHDSAFDDMGREITLANYISNTTRDEDGHCVYTLNIYPSQDMRDEWESQVPLYFAYAVAATFFAVIITFFVYDGFVRRQNKVVTEAAARSNKLVSSLFPSTVRDRLLADEDGKREAEQGAQTRIKNFLANDVPNAVDMEETDDLMYKTKPIADLFPETTILFADIAGFTAWSSAREPSQVFTLLETVYRAFDGAAQRRRIFKVETVGDCYVAATGLPEPRKDHAVAMARFARECLFKMQALTRRLEVTLGPDTADLAMRMGIHSGPVTAGVLRGERSRFQLFGDTMNTASRMESTGVRDKIQLSQETADLLLAAGKQGWIIPREDLVVAKGKGELKTFWLELTPREGGSVHSDDSSDQEVPDDIVFQTDEGPSPEAQVVFSDKALRLIDWNVDLLLRLLQLIVARRQVHAGPLGAKAPQELPAVKNKTTPLEEVSEIIVLPEFDQAHNKNEVEPSKVVLDPAVELQLYEYVTAVASMYRKNAFHNFEHASHVTMSVAKLLSRIVAPSDLDFKSAEARDQSLHDHTYGITSDPVTQFACVLSALIHDVDHTGVPNTQLIKENARIAKYYSWRSVAEQNSVDVSWDLLMQDDFSDLRTTIYSTEEEMKRFRQLVVNCVMATDIMDKELKELRNSRWDTAFYKETNETARKSVNRKATIVIEHLIQASDVAHTMQHWHIYRKWNARLFEEMFKAFFDGRSEKNPADFWYKGEIGFFDFYIIPLAKKLKDCGVFGVSSDEYLNYAERNRKEWEARGQEVLNELIETMEKTYPLKMEEPMESAPEVPPIQ